MRNATISRWIAPVAFAIAGAAAWYLPPIHQMDNPWYFGAGGGYKAGRDFPFERPPHLYWRGRSRGDMAFTNNDHDPYAEVVTFQTDQDGFRNDTCIDRADLIVIGDSFTEAGNLHTHETYPYLLGERLGTVVRNLGRAGYTTPTELLVLEKYGLACKPRIVVWQLTEMNDLYDCAKYDRWVREGRPAWTSKYESAYGRLQSWQLRSPTYRLFAALRPRQLNHWRFSGIFTRHDGREIPIRFFRAPGPRQTAKDHPAWPTYAKALLKGHRLCMERNIRLIVIHVPMKFTVMGPFTRLTATGEKALAEHKAPSWQDSFRYYITSLCDSKGIEFIDATDHLRQWAAEGRLVYLPFDTHTSSRGHAEIAGLILSRLSSHP